MFPFLISSFHSPGCSFVHCLARAYHSSTATFLLSSLSAFHHVWTKYPADYGVFVLDVTFGRGQVRVRM